MGKSLIFLLIILFYSLNIHAGGQKLLPAHENWNYFASHIECTLITNKPYAKPRSGIYPKISVTLQYHGHSPYTLHWDKNFSRVLWQGKFILISTSGNKQANTKRLKYITSSTYDTQISYSMSHGKKIHSTYNYHVLPGRFTRGLFRHKGNVKFALYVKINGRLKKVSNTIVIYIN